MSGKIKIIIAALCLLASSASRAADSWEGYPIYGGFALGFVAASDTNCDYYGYNCDGNDMAFKIYAGRQFHRNLAFEVAYYDLGNLKNKGSLVTTTAETQGFNFSLLGMIPVSDRSFFYGKAGLMAWDADYTRVSSTVTTSSDSGTDFTYGAGFAFGIGNDYDFRIEYERLNELGDDYVAGGSSLSTFNFAGTIYFN